MIIVTVDLPICNVIRISFTPFRGIKEVAFSLSLPTACRYAVLLTPTKAVPHDWFGNLKGKKVLGLASGGGQQIPIFSALGAKCTMLDYSSEQCEREREIAAREGYDVEIIQFDMTQRLPFDNETFDLVFHFVSNCYVAEVKPIFKECFRVLKKRAFFYVDWTME